jgi:hypothetical protein
MFFWAADDEDDEDDDGGGGGDDDLSLVLFLRYHSPIMPAAEAIAISITSCIPSESNSAIYAAYGIAGAT